MTRTGDREIRSVSGRLPDNPGELACMHKYPVFPQIHNGGRIFLYPEGAAVGWVGAFKGGGGEEGRGSE